MPEPDIGCVCLAVGIAAMVWCVLAEQRPMDLWFLHTDLKYVLFCVSVAAAGTSLGFSQAAVEAILGDSVPTGVNASSDSGWILS